MALKKFYVLCDAADVPPMDMTGLTVVATGKKGAVITPTIGNNEIGKYWNGASWANSTKYYTPVGDAHNTYKGIVFRILYENGQGDRDVTVYFTNNLNQAGVAASTDFDSIAKGKQIVGSVDNPTIVYKEHANDDGVATQDTRNWIKYEMWFDVEPAA